MKLLAFDTSTSACVVAASDSAQSLQLLHTEPMQHGKVLLPMIDTVLSNLNLSLSEFDALAYGAGPGSYTGIRIASSACQALAYATQKPVISLSSLQLLAQSAWQLYQCAHVVVLINARMGEVYCGYYQLQGEVMEAVVADGVIKNEQLQDYLASHLKIQNKNLSIQVVGDGMLLFSKEWLAMVGLTIPDAGAELTIDGNALISLGMHAYESGKVLQAGNAQPLYLR